MHVHCMHVCHMPPVSVPLIASCQYCHYPIDLSGNCVCSWHEDKSYAVAEVAEVTVRGTAAPRPRSTFYTRSISDPGLIPLLIASGVSFTALQVGVY